MSLLNPIALWGLLALLVPIILHLLHKAETQERPWAAMQFLMEKEVHSSKRHSLREWLLLLARLILLAFLILALAQPLGRLFSFSGKTPDTVILLLDRSSGLGSLNQAGMSKMEESLMEVEEALSAFQNQTRLYLIDSATLELTPLLEVGNLSLLSQTTVVDSPCDVPKLLQTALNEVQGGTYGKVELWLISQQAQESWKASDTRWDFLKSGDPEVQVREFPISSTADGDLYLTVKSAELQDGMVNLMLNVSGGEEGETVSLSGKLADGKEIAETLTLSAEQLFYPIAFSAEAEVVSGTLSLPEDTNPSNNTAYFSAGVPRDFQTLLVTDEKNSRLTENFRKALALPSLSHQKVKWVSPEDFLLTDMNSAHALVWAASQDGAQVKDKITDFISRGKLAFLFPNPKGEAHAEGWFFGEVKEAPAQEFFTVSQWNQKDGPWRNAESAETLPLDRVQAVQYAETLLADAYSLAEWSGGDPLAARAYLGDGELYTLSTLPHFSWSNLENLGLHLIFFQRLFSEHLQKSGGGYMNPLEAGQKPFMAGLREEEGVPLAYNRGVKVSAEEISAKERKALFKKAGLTSQGSARASFNHWLIPCLYLALLVLLLEAFLVKGKRKEVKRG